LGHHYVEKAMGPNGDIFGMEMGICVDDAHY
jgi:hypothetical protein